MVNNFESLILNFEFNTMNVNVFQPKGRGFS